MFEWSEKFLDWVLLCTIFVMIAGFVWDIIKAFKDKKDLSKEHGDLSKEHDRLLREYDRLSKENDKIMLQNERQNSILSEINKELYGEIKKRDLQFGNLSLSQMDAYKQLEAFTFLMNEVKRLQTENVELKKKLSAMLEKQKIQEQDSGRHKRKL